MRHKRTLSASGAWVCYAPPSRLAVISVQCGYADEADVGLSAGGSVICVTLRTVSEGRGTQSCVDSR